MLLDQNIQTVAWFLREDKTSQFWSVGVGVGVVVVVVLVILKINSSKKIIFLIQKA